jgi:5-methylcytosine-specific restriction protein A
MNILTRILRRDPLCILCLARGHVTPSQEVDHIVPLHKGGSNRDDNLQGLCIPCHAEKTRRDLGWRPGTGVDGWPLDE